MVLSTALAEYCAENEIIFPSMEAFEARMDIPTVYYVFYDFFFKASVGDAKWKLACSEFSKETERLGTKQEEAFAFLTLKNNYFAWLWEAKGSTKKVLVTDYDSRDEALLSGKKSLNEYYLKIEFNLEKCDSEEEATRVPRSAEVASGVDIVVYPSVDQELYKNLLRESERETATCRKRSLDDLLYEKIMPALSIEMPSEKEARKKKKAKIMRDLKRFTTKAEDETGFKGWSPRAAEYNKNLLEEWKEDGKDRKEQLFNAAYRYLYRESNNEKKTNEKERNEVPVETVKACWGFSAEEIREMENVIEI